MATEKRSQLSVMGSTAPGHRAAEPHRTAVFVGGAVAAALTTALLAFTGPGAAAAVAVFGFLEFYCGVFTLVALSLTIMVGLAATDRVVLLVRHRVLMQGLHRALAMAAMVFLGLHVATKVIEGHASVVDVLVPFLHHHRPLTVGLGTLASYLMIGVTITGVTRGRFAGSPHVWLWRALHAGAYACWPIALLHGLGAGRAAKTWVNVSYVLCVVLVGLALAARGYVLYGTRLRGPRTQTTTMLRPVGKINPVATSIALGPETGGARTSPGATRGARRPGPTEPDWRHDTGSTPVSPAPARRGDTGSIPVTPAPPAARTPAPSRSPPRLPAAATPAPSRSPRPHGGAATPAPSRSPADPGGSGRQPKSTSRVGSGTAAAPPRSPAGGATPGRIRPAGPSPAAPTPQPGRRPDRRPRPRPPHRSPGRSRTTTSGPSCGARPTGDHQLGPGRPAPRHPPADRRIRASSAGSTCGHTTRYTAGCARCPPPNWWN